MGHLAVHMILSGVYSARNKQTWCITPFTTFTRKQGAPLTNVSLGIFGTFFLRLFLVKFRKKKPALCICLKSISAVPVVACYFPALKPKERRKLNTFSLRGSTQVSLNPEFRKATIHRGTLSNSIIQKTTDSRRAANYHVFYLQLPKMCSDTQGGTVPFHWNKISWNTPTQ